MLQDNTFLSIETIYWSAIAPVCDIVIELDLII